MCGICGTITKRNITKEQLSAMNDTMAERGPDDAGAELWELPGGAALGLAQRRLSILDLSPLGHQPMSTPDGRVSLVYNGEIYNYREIRSQIPGYEFRSNCDTEVILAAYLQWGADCVSRFNGMFAIALYDRMTGQLILARDRAGQKPLYYWLDGGNVVFASVMAPILTCPWFPKRIRREILPRYLYQEYIHAPETIFEDVYQVEPGTVLTFLAPGEGLCGAERTGEVREGKEFPPAGAGDSMSRKAGETAGRRRGTGASAFGAAAGAQTGPWAGHILRRRYWSVPDVYGSMQENPVTDFGEARARLKELLQQSVRRRMIADVPLGTFLSGGYDSSLISALAQEQLGGTPLQTFSIGFDQEAYDESPYARAVARHLGTDHTQLIISEQDMFDLVAELPKVFDEPMADSSQIPTLLVSKLARGSVTVALSGDAGDEFYCGYGIYDRVRQAQQLDRIGALAHGIGQLPAGHHRKLEERYPFRVRVIAANRDPLTKTQFGAGSYVDLARSLVLNPDASDGPSSGAERPGQERGGVPGLAGGAEGLKFLSVNYEWEDRYPSQDWQVKRMLLDMETYLPDDILVKVDRASMRFSLESRCPFLDPEVMEYSFRIDHGLKYHKEGKGWSRKYILKQIAYDYIPKELLERPKKGFSVPLSDWLRGPLREQLAGYADGSFLRRQGLFDADRVADLTARFLAQGDAGSGTGQNYSKLLWSFFVFEQWAEYWGIGG